MAKRSDKVQYANNCLTIYYRNYGEKSRNYGELFDFLGDYDIITASELGKDVVLFSGDVYFFSHENERDLQKNSKVSIYRYGLLDEFIDINNPDDLAFSNWYNWV